MNEEIKERFVATRWGRTLKGKVSTGAAASVAADWSPSPSPDDDQSAEAATTSPAAGAAADWPHRAPRPQL